ncbi:unnamed protein product [Prorocentrum cordatum]|uniref:RRM domain-containing protein n=1 Tax=Prorocentrum cordatum TaxID=2364126 RepID=A0ABN9UH71_9DINO|nr:unnamed protein product [Polarella glacialis]
MAAAQAERTLFLGNLPRSLNRDEVMRWLTSSGYGDSYDFLYVPRCLKTNRNKGYMFINFMQEETARQFTAQFDSVATGHGCAQFTVSLSEHQGIEACLATLRKSSSRRIKNPQATAYVRHKPHPESSTAFSDNRTAYHAPGAQPLGVLRPLAPGLADAALLGRAGHCRFEGASVKGVAPSAGGPVCTAAATSWAEPVKQFFSWRGPGEPRAGGAAAAMMSSVRFDASAA